MSMPVVKSYYLHACKRKDAENNTVAIADKYTNDGFIRIQNISIRDV